MERKRKICIIPGCKSHLEKENYVSLHIFAKDDGLKQRWIEGIQTAKWIPNLKKHSKICSNHFAVKTRIGNKMFHIPPNSIPNDTNIHEKPTLIVNESETDPINLAYDTIMTEEPMLIVDESEK